MVNEMDARQKKSRIFITSTNRALPLAMTLKEKLPIDCEAVIWRDECEGLSPTCVQEMLDNCVKECDFAVIILTRDDLDYRAKGDLEEWQALDNCFYEAGLFIAKLGADRCFLISDIESEMLPLNFENFFHDGPANLADDRQWENLIKTILEKIDASVKLPCRETLPLLPVEKIFERERPEREGGQLQEGYVMVYDDEPFINDEWARQVKRNFDFGISYIYFFEATKESARKIAAVLKIMLQSAKAGELQPVGENQFIKETLEDIRQNNSLNIHFMKSSSVFRFRLHNAGDPQKARAYLRYGNTDYFVEWREGVDSKSIWDFFHIFAEPTQKQSLFRSNKDFQLDEEKDFVNTLKEEIGKTFQQIGSEVVNLCFPPG